MDRQDRITIDPKILVGKPVIKGTRIAVEFVIDLLAQGWSEPEILRNYPGLTHEDILACLKYAGEILHSEKVYPMTAAQRIFLMRFLANENVPLDAVVALREDGYDVMWVRTDAPGSSDEDILARTV